MSYSRRKVLAAILRMHVVVFREGANHTVLRGPDGRQTVIARHAQLDRITTRKIAKQLGLNWSELEKEIR